MQRDSMNVINLMTAETIRISRNRVGLPEGNERDPHFNWIVNPNDFQHEKIELEKGNLFIKSIGNENDADFVTIGLCWKEIITFFSYLIMEPHELSSQRSSIWGKMIDGLDWPQKY